LFLQFLRKNRANLNSCILFDNNTKYIEGLNPLAEQDGHPKSYEKNM